MALEAKNMYYMSFTGDLANPALANAQAAL